MPQPMSLRLRAGATFAAAATVAGLVPMLAAAAPAAAATACTAPTGLSPDDGFQSTAPPRKDVVLAWSPVSGATKYQVQVSQNEDFTNNIALDITTAANRFPIPVAAISDASYFWRVRVDGSACWSDGGAAHAASFSKQWNDAPASLSPAAGATSAPNPYDFRFSWKPIKDAAYYEVEVYDATTGQRVGRCFTDQTVLTPYATPFPGESGAGSPERLPNPSDCFAPTDLEPGTAYAWHVRAFDATGVALLGSAYTPAVTGASTYAAPPEDFPTGTVRVLDVSPRFGGVVGGDQLTITGAGFTGTTTVSIDGVAATAVNVIDSTHLTAYTAAAAGPITGDVVVTSSGGIASKVNPRDHFTYFDDSHGLPVEGFGKVETSLWSPTQTFTLGTAPANGSSLPAPTGVTISQPGSNGVLSPCATCGTTPTISWNAVSGAAEYRVYLYQDVNLTRVDRVYETEFTSVTPREDLLDNQAGHSYYVLVQSCEPTQCDGVAPVVSFHKQSAPVGGISLPANGASLSDQNVTLAWSDYLATNGTAQGAAQYHVQVSTSCSFSATVDDAMTDVPEFTSPTQSYGDGTYYWRVQVVDNSGSPLTWGPAPNSSSSEASATCGDLQRFTVARQAGTTAGNGGAGGGTGVVAPLTLHYGQPVNGLTADKVHLVEGSTGSYVPAEVTLLPDGASVKPLVTLVPGEYYRLVVDPGVTDSSGAAVSPTSSTYRAPTFVESTGAPVHRGGLWVVRKPMHAHGGTVLAASVKKRPTLSMRFRSGSATVGYCKSPAGGYAAIYVDGKLKKSLSTFKAFSACGSTYTVTGLDASRQHTVAVVETHRAGLRGGTLVLVDYFKVA